MSLVEQFNDYRSRMNDRIMDSDNLIIKRIFNLDTNCYAPGHLDEATTARLGLACSVVVRCDDVVKDHLG